MGAEIPPTLRRSVPLFDDNHVPLLREEREAVSEGTPLARASYKDTLLQYGTYPRGGPSDHMNATDGAGE